MSALLVSRKEGWKFRGFSRKIYSDKYLKRDNVHSSSNALRGIGYILKSKILYKRFCPEVEEVIRILLSAKEPASVFLGQSIRRDSSIVKTRAVVKPG